MASFWLNGNLPIRLIPNGDGSYDVAVSGSSGGLTNTELRAAPVEVTAAAGEEGPLAWVPRVDNGAAPAEDPGLYQVCALTTESYPIAVPPGVKTLLLWFEGSTSDETIRKGRVAFHSAGGALTGLVATDNNLGNHPPQAIEYVVPAWATYVHVGTHVAGRVAFGQWTYE